MSIPAFFFSELLTCNCCGKVKMFDEGGTPCDPEHPFCNLWICDECDDKIRERRKPGRINPEFEEAVQKMIEEEKK